MEKLQESLNLLVNGEAWPGVAIGLRIALAVVVIRLLYLALRHVRRGAKQTRSGIVPAQPWLFAPLLFLFVGTLAHQASWQLFGLSRPKFVQFMQKYDRRHFNPAHSIARGKILDREGRIIAYSLKKGSSVNRQYRLGPMFSHVVGYADPKYGMTGLENAAHTYLIGGGLGSLKEWKSFSKTIIDRSDATPGQDLTLTIDAELQKIGYEALQGKKGAVVLMDVNDGALLALVSAPSFNPNDLDAAMKRADHDEGAMLNRATQGLYPPGSTFKVVVAAAAFKQGWTGALDCPAEGYTTSSNYPYIRDHEYYTAEKNGKIWNGHGRLDLSTALSKSSNVFFSKLGVELGHDAMAKAAVDFGMSANLFIYQAGSDQLSVTDSRYPKLSKSDLYGLAQVSIGQGKLLVTPMEMCVVAAGIANDGVILQPRLHLQESPSKWRRCMNAQHAQLLSEMMRKVVLNGTARGIATAGFSSAGKTGTAQNPHGDSHAWYIGFAPAQDPQLAVCVLVENGGYGSAAALPIARKLLMQANKLGYLEGP